MWMGKDAEEAGETSLALTIGQRLRVPPLLPHWDDKSKWRELFRWKWSTEEHINLLEMRCGLAAARHAGRSSKSWGKRILLFTDSMVTLGAFAKGRSSSPSVLHLCRRMASVLLSSGMKCYWRHVETDRNHMDGPSRGGALGVMPKSRSEQVVKRPKALDPRCSGLF